MSRMSELEIAVSALRDSAKAITAAADALTELFSSNAESPPDTPIEPTQPTPEKAKPEKVADTMSAQFAQKRGTDAAQQRQTCITLEEVRAVLAEKSRNGHSAEVKVLLERHGASRLSDVDPAEYPALLKEAEVIR